MAYYKSFGARKKTICCIVSLLMGVSHVMADKKRGGQKEGESGRAGRAGASLANVGAPRRAGVAKCMRSAALLWRGGGARACRRTE